MKKVLSFVLCFVLLLCLFAPVSTSAKSGKAKARRLEGDVAVTVKRTSDLGKKGGKVKIKTQGLLDHKWTSTTKSISKNLKSSKTVYSKTYTVWVDKSKPIGQKSERQCKYEVQTKIGNGGWKKYCSGYYRISTEGGTTFVTIR